MSEEQIRAKELGRNNLIWVDRTEEWMRIAEVFKPVTKVENTETNDREVTTQVFVRLQDGHELVFDGEELVRVRE